MLNFTDNMTEVVAIAPDGIWWKIDVDWSTVPAEAPTAAADATETVQCCGDDGVRWVMRVDWVLVDGQYRCARVSRATEVAP